MTSKNKNALTMALCITNESWDPRNKVAARHPGFDSLTTFNDLQIENVLTIVGFQTKARNQGNTVAATYQVFEFLMT